MFLVEMMRRLIGQTRVCPHCGHRQQALLGDRPRERCEKCGATLPPLRDRGPSDKG